MHKVSWFGAKSKDIKDVSWIQFKNNTKLPGELTPLIVNAPESAINTTSEF